MSDMESLWPSGICWCIWRIRWIQKKQQIVFTGFRARRAQIAKRSILEKQDKVLEFARKNIANRKCVNIPEAQKDKSLRSRTNRLSQTMSTQKIMSSTGTRQQSLPVSLIREAVKVCQESQGVMNRDEGAYQLSHIYNKLLLSMWTSSQQQSFGSQ